MGHAAMASLSSTPRVGSGAGTSRRKLGHVERLKTKLSRDVAAQCGNDLPDVVSLISVGDEAAFGIVGSSDGPGSGGSTNAANGSGGSTAQGSPTSSGSSTGGGDPIFETDIIPIFENSCGASDVDCHRREAYAANWENDCRGWASLENAAIGSTTYPMEGEPKLTDCPDTPLYDRLITIAGWTCGPPFSDNPLKFLVVPCDPEASLIIDKVEKPTDEQCIANDKQMEQMPPGATLDPAETKMLRDWIANGAPTLSGGTDCGS